MSLPSSHPRLLKRPFSLGELVADGIVHCIAILAGVIGFAVLLTRVTMQGDLTGAFAVGVYAAGFFLMFGFSLAYNMTPPSALKWVLRRFDHSSIYLMIAGTYTALLVHFRDPAWGWTLATIVWIGALGGGAMKLLVPGRYDRLSIVFFLLLGGAGLAAIGPASSALPTPTLFLLALGGLTYAAGIAFYKWHSLLFHNAIWHGCVAIAAGLHFAGIAYAFVAQS
jgi:hemolysin III